MTSWRVGGGSGQETVSNGTRGPQDAVETASLAGSPRPVPSVKQFRIDSRGAVKVFGDGKRKVSALGPVDFTIEDGSFVCIVGPSGCGKSTLLRILAGLIAPSEGEIEIWCRDPDKALSAMVFQDHSVFPWKSVRQNVALGLDVRRRLTRSQKKSVWTTGLSGCSSRTSLTPILERCRGGCASGCP